MRGPSSARSVTASASRSPVPSCCPRVRGGTPPRCGQRVRGRSRDGTLERVTATRPTATDRRTVGVLICTYQRSERLRHALAGLRAQTLPADEVLVVVRPDDAPSREVVAGTTGLPLREVL